MRKPMANALDIDLRGGLTDQVTPHAGAALLIDCIRRRGCPPRPNVTCRPSVPRRASTRAA